MQFSLHNIMALRNAARFFSQGQRSKRPKWTALADRNPTSYFGDGGMAKNLEKAAMPLDNSEPKVTGFDSKEDSDIFYSPAQAMGGSGVHKNPMIVQRRMPFKVRKQLSVAGTSDLLQSRQTYKPTPVVGRLLKFLCPQTSTHLQENGSCSPAAGRYWNQMMQSAVNSKSELTAGDCAHLLRGICRFAYEDKKISRRSSAGSSELARLKAEAVWSDRSITEHESHVSGKIDFSDLSVESVKSSRLRRMQRRLAARSEAKSDIDVELTVSVLELCLEILNSPEHLAGLFPTLAADTVLVLEELYSTTNPHLRSIMWEISGALMQNLSMTLDLHERAEAARDALMDSPKFKLLVKKKGAVEAEKILMNMVNNSDVDMSQNTWLENKSELLNRVLS